MTEHNFGYNRGCVSIKIKTLDNYTQTVSILPGVDKTTPKGLTITLTGCKKPVKDTYIRMYHGVVTPHGAKTLKQFCYWLDLARQRIIKSVWEYVCRFTNPHRPNTYILSLIHKHYILLEELKADGLEHLQGICLLVGMLPKDAKKSLGKGLWKQLCRNSQCKNDWLFRVIVPGNKAAHYLRHLNRVPVSYLRYYHHTDPNRFRRVVEYFRKYERSNTPRKEYKGRIERILHQVADAEFMGRRAEVRFNENWSIRRILREHERLVLTTRMGNVPDVELDYGAFHKSEVTAGVGFSPFNRTKDIVQRGIDHGHCVGSYANTVAIGKYLVYSVEYLGEEYTLGCSVVDGKVLFSQCYGKYNSIAPDEVISAARKFVDRLNGD